jgi:hypothetical protein
MAVIMSYTHEGKGPKLVGLLGIAGFLTALTGIVFSKSAWKSPDGGIMMKRLSGIINLILLIISVILYIIGWM